MTPGAAAALSWRPFLERGLVEVLVTSKLRR